MHVSYDRKWEDIFYDELAVCAETGAVGLMKERYHRRKQAFAELWAGSDHWDVVKAKLDRIYREVKQDYRIE